MLPLPRVGGAHLSRIAAYMGLALHEMPGVMISRTFWNSSTFAF